MVIGVRDEKDCHVTALRTRPSGPHSAARKGPKAWAWCGIMSVTFSLQDNQRLCDICRDPKRYRLRCREMARVCCKVSLFVTARLLWEGAVT